MSRADASRFIAPGITTPHACSSDDDPKTESPQEQADVQMTYPLIEGIWAKLTPKGTVTVVGTDSES